MGKGAKIAIGCGCLLLLVIVAVVAILGTGAYWAKGKLESAGGSIEALAAQGQEIEEWQKKAEAIPYAAPANGVISEARLVTFLEVRKRVHAVYENHAQELKQITDTRSGNGDRKPTLSEGFAAVGTVTKAVTDIRLALVKALAELGMNEREYRDIQVAVYKSAWAAESQKESGRLPSEQVSEAQRQAREASAKAAAEAETAGTPLSAEQRQAIEKGLGELGKAARELEGPEANVALFRKYEADIRRYAMTGLEAVGL